MWCGIGGFKRQMVFISDLRLGNQMKAKSMADTKAMLNLMQINDIIIQFNA